MIGVMATAGVTDRGSVLERADQLVALISSRAAEGEAARRIPDDVFSQIDQAGLLDLLVPQSLGGLELDPLTAFEAIETVSRADGSTGWVTMILNGSFMVSWVESDAAIAITGNGGFRLAGMFAPLGVARAEGDSFRVTGRWPFNSGSVHASWMLGGVMVMDGNEVRTRDDGLPDWRFAMFPADKCEIHDTWHASGLKATSSHDISVEDVLVPASLTPSPVFDRQLTPGPMSRIPFFGQLSCLMAGVPLGIARRALDETAELVRTRSRGSSVMIERTDVQNDLIRSETQLRAARTFAVDAISRAWDTAVADQPLSTDQRLSLRMAAQHAGWVGIEVVDRCFRLGGGSALYEHSPLQRCWRDVHALTHHAFHGDEQLRDFGNVWLGVTADSLYM